MAARPKVFTVSGYHGERVAALLLLLRDTSTWAPRHRQALGRWQGVERTLAWICRCRRLARTSKTWPEPPPALIRLAMIKLMASRLT